MGEIRLWMFASETRMQLCKANVRVSKHYGGHFKYSSFNNPQQWRHTALNVMAVSWGRYAIIFSLYIIFYNFRGCLNHGMVYWLALKNILIQTTFQTFWCHGFLTFWVRACLTPPPLSLNSHSTVCFSINKNYHKTFFCITVFLSRGTVRLTKWQSL